MMNHKWKDESFSKFNKEMSCVRCGLFKTWQGGDMQSWMYWYPSGHKNHEYASKFKRPDCLNQTQ